MKKLLMILAIMVVASPAAAQLIITGVMDGPLTGGLPKMIELFACDDIEDLSIYGIGCANNGGGSDGIEFTFPADFILGGSYIYCIDDDGTSHFNDYFGIDFTYDVGAAANNNGDDAIELFLVDGAVVVDVYGDINQDGTGTAWEYLDGFAKRIPGTGPDGSTFDPGNWTYSGPNALDGCTTNGSCGAFFLVGLFYSFYCDPTVGDESMSFGSIKSLYR